MELVELAEVVKLAANIGSAALLGVVVLVLTRVRDKDEERDAAKDKAYIGLLSSMSDANAAITARMNEQTSALATIIRTLNEVNPERYRGYWRGAVEDITAVIQTDADVRAGQFEEVDDTMSRLATAKQVEDGLQALKTTITDELQSLTKQVFARLDAHAKADSVARDALSLEVKTATERITDELDRLAVLAQTYERGQTGAQDSENKAEQESKQDGT